MRKRLLIISATSLGVRPARLDITDDRYGNLPSGRTGAVMSGGRPAGACAHPMTVTAPVRPDERFPYRSSVMSKAGGRTPSEVAEIIKSRLSAYIREPMSP